MTLQQATLTITADVDGDGTDETGVFEMVGDLEVSPSLRTGFLFGGRNSQVNSILANLLSKGDSRYQEFFLDLGAGQHAIAIECRLWEDSTDASGNPLQWGNDSAKSKTQASATGQDPLTQIDVFMKYLLTATVDSRAPATLEYGEFSSGGLYSALDVVIEQPQLTRVADDGEWADLSMTCLAAASLDETHDATKQLEY